MTMTKIAQWVKTLAKDYPGPGGATYLGIAPQDVAQIAAEADCFGYEVEIAALEANIWPQRYVRNTASISMAEQISLLKANVLVIGLGGLGGLLVSLLARMGVGRLTLVDFDHFDATNLNRQMLSNMDVLGQSKAKTALAHVKAVNPSVNTTIYEKAFDNSSINLTLFENRTICADCLDNLKNRLELAHACQTARVPLVSASVGGFCGQLTVIYPENGGLEAVYGLPETGCTCSNSKGLEVDAGTPGPTAAATASLQAMEIAKVIMQKNTTLKNSVVLFDFNTFSMQVVDL